MTAHADGTVLAGAGATVLAWVIAGRADMARPVIESLTDEALHALGLAADAVVILAEAEAKRRNPDEAPPMTQEKAPLHWPPNA